MTTTHPFRPWTAEAAPELCADCGFHQEADHHAVLVPLEDLRIGDRLDQGTYAGFEADPHPRGRAGWVLLTCGRRYAESAGAQVRVWNRTADGHLMASVVLDVYAETDGYAEDYGVTLETVGSHPHGPLVRFSGTRDQLRRLVADNWCLSLSFADGAPTLQDLED